ncbi:30S ribosomal protein S14 [Arcanobacterium phocae]|uniref:30S ribosomal protein S14 n=1 Tax=Arcanobacterium phocae TaxID=131112 RepID=UPI001C0EE7B3
MAKRSKIVADQRRQEIVAKYAERRAQLKKMSVDVNLSASERDEAMRALHALPRDASPTRLRNRDVVDGRPRGFVGKFGLSRVRFRKMAHEGLLPGVTKSSW